MNTMRARHQICLAVTVATLVVFELIVPIKSIKTSSESTRDLELQKSLEAVKSSKDSKASANGQFGSFFSAKHAKLPNPEFSRLQADIDTHMTNVNFNFDPAEFEEIDLPQEQSIQPKKLLNFEPLRPYNYFSPEISNYNPYSNDELPEHQDDGGDGDGDGSDGGGDSGGDGGGGGGNGGGGGGGGGGDGGGGRRDDEDEQSFVQQQSIELDYDSLEPQNANGWRPIHPNYGSLRPRLDQPRKKLAPKKISGYGAHQIPVPQGNSYYHNPQSQRLTYNQRQPHSFDDMPYSPYDVEERKPLKVYKEDTQPFRQQVNNIRPLRIRTEDILPLKTYSKIERNPPRPAKARRPAVPLDEEEEEDEPRPLQSRRQPTRKRQICHKIKKSMTPNDIEDHDVIGRKMMCMRCKDIASGGLFEKCSYSSQPQSGEYYRDTQVFKETPARGKADRFKRRVRNPQSEEVEDYEYENANQAEESEEEPEYAYNAEAAAESDNENPENHEAAENESEEYRIPPMPIKSATCSKVKKKGNICNVCRDNLTNRKYETCEYESDPDNNAYEYSTQNVYGSPRYKRQLDSDRTYDDYFRKLFPELGSDRKSSLATKFSSKDGDFGFLDNGQIGFKKTKSKLLGDKDLSINFDSGEESEVNRMLGEFRNKDRSKCKKSLKDKMTCYKCKDEKGSETEECMYITDGGPKEHKQSYHETKKFNNNPLNEEAKSANQNRTQHQPASSSLSHAYAPLFSSAYEPTGAYSDYRPHRRQKNYRLHSNPVVEEPAESVEVQDDQSEAQSSSSEDYEEDPTSKRVSRHDLPEVDPFGPEGAFSEETVPVYDAQLGTWLPRYMVMKSEEEASVDAELGFD